MKGNAMVIKGKKVGWDHRNCHPRYKNSINIWSRLLSQGDRPTLLALP